MERKKIFAILISGFILRLILARTSSLYLDLNTFIAWGERMADFGPGRFYDAWSDYLPGYLYILWGLSSIKHYLSISPEILYKLPGIMSDLGVGAIIYFALKDKVQAKMSLLASFLYVFNPAIIFNSTLWGQVDGLTAFFAILSIFFVQKNIFLSSLFLSVGTLIKPQAAIAGIVILAIFVREKWKLEKILRLVLSGFLFFVVAFIPFANGRPLIPFVVERVLAVLSQYEYTSVNAFNFWGIQGMWVPEGSGVFTAKEFGLTLFSLFATVTFYHYYKYKRNIYALLAILFVANFLFFTRMHERHLLPAFAPLAIAASFSPVMWIPYIGLSFTYVLNMRYAFIWITQEFKEVFSQSVIIGLILVNFASFALLLFTYMGKLKKFSLPKIKSNKETFRPLVPKSLISVCLLIILALSFFVRLHDLEYPQSEYFDEVYHAFTARAMLNVDVRAWEWWNESPEGFAYEWTHPPLAKEGMVLGMLIFGENSLGWRFPGIVLGTLSLYLVFLIGRELTGSSEIGLFACTLLALDGLFFVMSRIGMNDIYLLFFILLSFYLFLRDKVLLSSIAFGFALSSKWSAIWFIPIIAIAHFTLGRSISKRYLVLLAIPVVYLASYVPMFLTGHSLETFINMQKQMWWYHTGLEATHPYTSPWWSWPLLVRPIWLFTTGATGGAVGNIYAMGNPVFFWSGAASVLVAFYYAVVRKNKKIALLIFSYLVFFVPWALSPRIMFLYHYLPSLPFMAILSGYVLRKNLWLSVPVLLLSFFAFLYFYPHWSGQSVPSSLDQTYYLFSSWR